MRGVNVPPPRTVESVKENLKWVETPVAIETHIAEKRAELGRDLSEMERRGRKAADWREQARRHPDVVLAGAFGLGMLLGLIPRVRKG